jgi:hypothetical protein
MDIYIVLIKRCPLSKTDYHDSIAKVVMMYMNNKEIVKGGNALW